MKQVNPIKKALVKQNILKGQSFKQAMRNAGYTEASAMHSTGESVVKCARDEILNEMKASDVTVDMVIKNLHEDRSLAKRKGDISTMSRVDELLGKFLAIFTERREVSQKIEFTEKERSEYELLTGRKLVSN